MIDQFIPEHHIQKHILGVLMHMKYARFRDMRPPKVDTNLYTYHLNILKKRGFVIKTDDGYCLGREGLSYVDRVSIKSLKIRTQPKIITMIIIQNANGDVLLQRRTKQPHIDTWTLPYGKLHIDDESVLAAAQREAREKLAVDDLPLVHAGDCYIRVLVEGEILSSTLAHVFYGETDEVVAGEELVWARPHRLADYDLAPAVEQIVARTFFRDPFFFEEFVAELNEVIERRNYDN